MLIEQTALNQSNECFDTGGSALAKASCSNYQQRYLFWPTWSNSL